MEIPCGTTNYKEEAEQYLNLLRQFPSDYDSLIVRFLSAISEGNLNFKDVGTDQEELESLRDRAPK